MGPRGASRGRGRLVELPANLLSIGVVHEPSPVEAPAPAASESEEEAPKAAKKRGGGRKRAAKEEPAVEGEAKPTRARSRTPRAKKTAARTGS
jgi:hypothetical protein